MLIFLLCINICAYALMWIDKMKSIYKKWRVSEKNLFFLAICGGVFGIWLGMFAPIYHKAGKRTFRIGIPIIALVWCVIIIWMLWK